MGSFFQPITDCITVLFFLVIFSYYVLVFRKPHRPNVDRAFKSLTIVVTAHNEEPYIAAALRSAIAADFAGEKEIVCIDDGSLDRTAEIAAQFPQVRLIRKPHTGKSASMNLALAEAKGEVVAFLDGDSEMSANTMVEMARNIEQHNFVGTTCPVLVKNRNKSIFMWLHIDSMYASFLHLILAKVNANIVNSGQCGMFRKKELMESGGFCVNSLNEDMELAIRLVRLGYHLGFTEGTVSYTNMPEDFGWFVRQRVRWMRGGINVLTQHLRLSSTLIDLYTMPLLVFGYVQAVVMTSFTFYQIGLGYWTYFASQGHFVSLDVARFLLDWCSITGLLRWSFGFFSGDTPVTAINVIGAMASLLSYPLFVFAIVKFDRKIDLFHIIPLCFMAPFWWLIACIQIISLPEIFHKPRPNVWTKKAVSVSVDGAASRVLTGSAAE